MFLDTEISMAGSFVKAIYDYHSNEQGDLVFDTGAVIQVVNVVDQNWVNGRLGNRVGLFPANFAEPTTPPSKPPPELNTDIARTVVATDTYIAGEDGVLTIFRGDVITLLGRVDEYWCKGSFDGQIGLFPAFIASGLDDVLATGVGCENAVKVEKVATEASIKDVSVPDEPCVESLFEFHGDTEVELSFPAGELILLTKDVDSDWFEGSFQNKSGIFPKSFVKVLSPLTEKPPELIEKPELTKKPAELTKKPKLTEKPELTERPEVRNAVEDIVPFAVAAYPFVGETRHELSFRAGDIIYLRSWVSPEWIEGECDGMTGIFPSSFVHVEVELPREVQDKDVGYEWERRNGYGEEVTAESEKELGFKVGDTAVAIYDFTANIKGDLPLEVGDLITVERVIDDEWIQGRKNEVQVGLCPAVFLELINNASGLLDSSILSNTCDDDRSCSTSLTTVSKPIQNTTKQLRQPSQNSQGGERTKPLPLGPKPTLAPKPKLAPKPDFLKKSTKTALDKIQTQNHLVRSANSNTDTAIHDSTSNEMSLTAKHQVWAIKGMNDHDKNLLETGATSSSQSSGRRNRSTNSPGAQGWVTFNDHQESLKSKSINDKPSSSTALEAERFSGNTTMSYKTLLDKSLTDDLPAPLKPEAGAQNKPQPPPRIDLMTAGKSVSGSDVLSNKLMNQQAEEFELSHSRKSSPSLNELRETSLKSKDGRPMPVQRIRARSRPPSFHADPDSGEVNAEFPIFDELDEKMTKLNNELEKETQVLSGVDVLIQTVNKESPKREELESKKAITERKLVDLKRQLKKVEGHKKQLVKLVAGYSSQVDIKLKVIQLEESVKENVETKNCLQSLLKENDDPETRAELQENILFCEKAIGNMQSELKSLKDILDQLEGREFEKVSLEQQKDVNLRKKVIDEILDTEKSFNRDLNLCVDHYMKQLIEWKVDGIDYDVLFANMPEVASLSSRLLDRLEAATHNVDINDQIIGSCFVDFSDDITIIYGSYCKNHDEAIAFLEKSANDEEIQQRFKKCLESIREHSSCWDLSSFLIKPVQRILKYPLLLNGLLKHTPDDHPDKSGLIKAIEVMSTAANDVNEFKRRKDIVQKYQKVEESGLSTKFQKFTWHSVVKKSTRFNQRITQFTGLVSQTVDESFNEKERTFHQIEKTIKNFNKNVLQYLEQFEEVQASQMQTAENIVDFHQPDPISKNIQEFYDAQKYIGGTLLQELKSLLDEDVLSPLKILMQLFEGPRRLMQKRHDKCLDYDSWSNKIEKIKDRDKRKQAKDELEFAKKNYEALNAQLLDELPVFNDKALIFLHTCIRNFANVHKNFFVNAMDKFSHSVQLQSAVQAKEDIVTKFLTDSDLANHDVFQLTFTPKKHLLSVPQPARPMLSPKSGQASPSFDDRLAVPGGLKRSKSEIRKLSPTSEFGISRSQTVSVADRSLLKKRSERRLSNPSVTSPGQADMKENSVYIVTHMFLAEGPTELSLEKGDVVGVLNRHDKIGNSEWWKVERVDGKSGYIPASFLEPHGGSDSTAKAPADVVNTSGGSEYTALYDFTSRGPEEVTMVAGDLVMVLQYHDLNGQSEWWLVEVNGLHGYAPATYLAKS